MSSDPWRNARVMCKKDTCTRKTGIELTETDDGFAQMGMTISADMLNGHWTCHGSQLFTLANTAFAYAYNSQGLAAVASTANIDFLRSAFADGRLVATVRVKQQGKLTGVCDIEVVNQQQKIMALFRGKSHHIGDIITGDVQCATPLFVTGFARRLAATAARWPVSAPTTWRRSRHVSC